MSFITELKRRNVIRTAVGYLALAWLVIEVSNTILPMFDFGAGLPRLIVIGFAIGFLPVLLFTWAFEFTPDGLKLERDVDRAAPQVVAAGKRLDRFIIVLLGLALAWFAVDKFVITPRHETEMVEAARQQAAAEALEKAQKEAFDQSIAILPFDNASGSAGNDYLSNGLSDELRDRLAQVPGLRVIARSSSIRIFEQDLGLEEIAARLGVSRVIEGRFNQQGDRVLLSVQLIDASTSFQLWSRTFETKSRELLVMQQDLSRAVLGQLMPELAPQAMEQAPSAQQISAYDLLLLGRQYEQQLTDQQVVDENLAMKAIEYYRQAIAADPQSAEAKARLGKMLLYVGDIEAAEAPIFKALELDPRLSDAHATLGLYYWITRQPGIGAAYLRAIEMNPNNADALSYYASWLWLQGRVNDSLRYYRLARDVDPASLVRYAELGYELAFEGHGDEADEIIAQILRFFPSAAGYLAAARIAEARESLDLAIAYALKARLLRPNDADIAGQLAELHARIGDFASANLFEGEPGMGQLYWQRRYPELIDLGEELVIDQPDDVDVVFLLVFALNTQGRFEESLRLLHFVGMPETAFSESRRANEIHALMSTIGALAGSGRQAQAETVAQKALQRKDDFLSGRGFTTGLDYFTMACSLAILGRDEEALSALETMLNQPTMASLPWVKDQACVQKYASEPRYLAVVSETEKRQARLREQLPHTLKQMGLLPEI